MKRAMLAIIMTLAAGIVFAAPPTDTDTPVSSVTPTYTCTDTVTPDITQTSADTDTQTSTVTPTITQTVTDTATQASTSTNTVVQSMTNTPTFTSTCTVTQTRTPTPTFTQTATVTLTGTVTPTITVTNTPLPTPTLEADLFVTLRDDVYPNPAKTRDTVYILLNGNGSSDIVIYTIDGRQAKREMLRQVSDPTGRYNVDISGLAPGVYYYRIIYSHNGFEDKGKVRKMVLTR